MATAASWLFDPALTDRLVLDHRPPDGRPVDAVVSDVVWHDIVGLLRWATASAHGDTDLQVGTWWRLAGSCADLLRRLPRLSDEIAEPWVGDEDVGAAGSPAELSAVDRIGAAADQLALLLRGHEPIPLRRLAAAVDGLGAAAVGALAGSSASRSTRRFTGPRP
jgi:hypothetical protein